MGNTLRGKQDGGVLLVGASRGLGHAMAGEFARREWLVTATVRGGDRTGLHDLVDEHPGRIEIETLDVTVPAEIAMLGDRLSGRRFDMLFVNAGTADRNQADTLAEVPDDEFVRVMLVNVLGVMRAVEGLQHLVRPDGLIGVMSSGQGSVGNNTSGGREVYRASKAALNQCMRSHAARHAGESRAMVLMAPGWIRTALGGPGAPLAIGDSIPKVVDVLVAQQGKAGLRYLDRNGNVVAW
ncbi:MAG: SDR family NAD(P)-dependent oxidoreductase [Gluconacetobacter diazotrophicus]|nr:SDR family NAD(P)-dependent oxidoreductase [Gluconacetobacter diazotrophicus]